MTNPMPKPGEIHVCYLFDPPQRVNVVEAAPGPCSSGTRVIFTLDGYNNDKPDECDSWWFTNPERCGLHGKCQPLYKAGWVQIPAFED